MLCELWITPNLLTSSNSPSNHDLQNNYKKRQYQQYEDELYKIRKDELICEWLY